MYSKTSKINYTPRKLRPVANLVKGLNAEYALDYLRNVDKKGARFVYKGIKSALSNAFVSGISISNLIVDEIRVDESMKLKRLMYASRRNGHELKKRYSTLIIKLR